MSERNQFNSNPSIPTDPNHSSDNTIQSASSDEKGKSIKALGRYNPVSSQTSPDEQPVQAFSNEGGPFGQMPNTQGVQTNFNQQPPGYGFPPNDQPPIVPSGKLKHTGLGITSFIFSLLGGLSIVIGIIVMVSGIMNLDMDTLEGMSDPAYIESMYGAFPTEFISVIVGVFIMFSSLFFAFIGLIFGIISLFIKNRRKIFGILGTIFNGVFLVGGFIFTIFSFLMSPFQ